MTISLKPIPLLFNFAYSTQFPEDMFYIVAIIFSASKEKLSRRGLEMKSHCERSCESKETSRDFEMEKSSSHFLLTLTFHRETVTKQQCAAGARCEAFVPDT